MIRPLLGAALAALALAVAAPAADAQMPVSGWDGANPFACTLQQAGYGIEFSDPAADPFCVEYDKRRQNVLPELGLVQFLMLEPARVAAASPKCFYFQHDHWRGSIVQDDEATETYNWDGSYFFDKSTGRGGAYVENFTINNQTGDPTTIPGFPEEWKPFFGPGRGGVQSAGLVRADPRCVQRPSEPAPNPASCRDAGGPIGRGMGGVRLGATRAEAEAAAGPPAREHRGFLRWCLNDGGKLAAGLDDDGRIRFILTTSPAFDRRGLRVGDRAREARARLRGERTLGRRGSTTVLSARVRAGRLIVGLRRGRVAYLALASRGLSEREIAGFLTRSR